MKTKTLKYIGAEPTLVRESLSSDKIQVKKGDTFVCEERLAKNYLRAYSSLFIDLGGGESKESANKKQKKADQRETVSKSEKKRTDAQKTDEPQIRVLTQADLDRNPEFEKKGLKVGDEVEVGPESTEK